MPISACYGLQGMSGIGVDQLAFALGQRCDFICSPVQNPDRTTIPVHREQLARGEIGEIDRRRMA